MSNTVLLFAYLISSLILGAFIVAIIVLTSALLGLSQPTDQTWHQLMILILVVQAVQVTRYSERMKDAR